MQQRLLRAAPLTALVAIAVVSLALRWERRARSPQRGAMASPHPAIADAEPDRDRGTLAAPPLLASIDAGVAAGTARMLHGDVRHTNRARGVGPARADVLWKTDVGGAVEAQVTASPDGQTLYAATLANMLVAIARDTGAIKWKLDLGDRVYSTPCVGDDGTIYVGSDAKRFTAVTPSGSVKWKLETNADADTGALIAPGGKIVFAAGRTLFAVRPGGDVAWRFQTKGKMFASPALLDDATVVVGAQDHRAYAVSLATGAQVWSTDLGADVDGSPAIGDDGAIFFGTDGDAVVRVGAKGDLVWRADVGGYVRGPLSIGRDGNVLAGVYGPRPREVRIDAASGKVIGTHGVDGTGAREFGVHGGAVEDDLGTSYFGAQDDAVYAVARDGTVRWRFVTGGDVDAPVTLMPDGALVVPSDDGSVYLLGAR